MRSQHSKDRRRQEALALSPRGTSPALGTFGLQDDGGQTSLVSSHQVGGGLLEETNALPFSGLCSPSRRAVVMFYFSRTRAPPAPASGSAAPGPPGCPPQCAGQWDRPAHAPDGPGAARSKAGPGQRSSSSSIPARPGLSLLVAPGLWVDSTSPVRCRQPWVTGSLLCASRCAPSHTFQVISPGPVFTRLAAGYGWGWAHDFFIFELPWLGPMA